MLKGKTTFKEEQFLYGTVKWTNHLLPQIATDLMTFKISTANLTLPNLLMVNIYAISIDNHLRTNIKVVDEYR